ncbi:MAG: thioesterase family protein [Myxococcaceae bacterium]|nr:thioesterase family protein [Myxococcaceae bacterium]
MAEPFVESFVARWPDMDFNQHMRNAAFLGCAEDTRMRFLASNGWPMREFQRLALGPVVLEDKLTYRKELALLEPFTVDLRVAGITDDARRMRVRNQFFRSSDQALCAVVESVVLWFDLSTRKPVVPPAPLADLWLRLARTDDFSPMT